MVFIDCHVNRKCLIGWTNWDRTSEMPESKSGALPLGYRPICCEVYKHRLHTCLNPIQALIQPVQDLFICCVDKYNILRQVLLKQA